MYSMCWFHIVYTNIGHCSQFRSWRIPQSSIACNILQLPALRKFGSLHDSSRMPLRSFHWWSTGHLIMELTTTRVVLVNGCAPAFAPFTWRTYAVMFTVVSSSMS